MGNPQHIEWLMEGPEAWNARRNEAAFTPNFESEFLSEINLSGYNLSGSNLIGCNLSLANLSHSNLSSSRLVFADLTRTNLWRADLQDIKASKADFKDADLNGANLNGADLFEAQLMRCGLWETDFENANMKFANVDGANARNANFTSVDFYGAKFGEVDLNEAVFYSAKLVTSREDKQNSQAEFKEFTGTFFTQSDAIFFNTLDLSKCVNLNQTQLEQANGDLGVILPDELFHPDHWAPDPSFDLTRKSFCFFSYAHQDRSKIQPLHKIINRQHSVWWDQDINGGASWRKEIKERLDDARCVITFWTANSINSKSVIEEASSAQKADKLIHILLEDVRLPYGFAETQYIDLRDWNGDTNAPQFQKLLQAIEDKFNPPKKEVLVERLSKASPIAFPENEGKLGVSETPVGSPPPTPNPRDVAERITQIGNLCDRLKTRIDNGEYNVPRDLSFALSDMKEATEIRPSRWYELSDAHASLKLLSDQASGENWNILLANQLKQISDHLAHIRPALEPKQIAQGNSGAKPPETDPLIKQSDVDEVAKIGKQLADATKGAEVGQVFDKEAKEALHRFAEALKDAATAQDFGEVEKRVKFARLRRVVRNTTMALGAATSAIGVGITTNVLTAPNAAQTLLARFKEILGLLLNLF